MNPFSFPGRAEWIQLTFAFSRIGIFLVIIGFMLTAYAVYWNTTALRVQATVVATEYDEAGNKSLILNYSDSVGNEHQIKVDPAAPAPSAIEGGKISILYHPDEPKKVRIDRFMDKWFLGGFMTIWGALVWWILVMIHKRLSRNGLRSKVN